MSYIKSTNAQIEKARQASLADYFIQNGYETERTRNELHIKGFGGLYINIDTNEWYCFSQADKHGGRNAINCLTEILGMDFKSAVEALTGERLSHIEYRTSEQQPQKKKELELPECADNMRKVFAYLCQTRMLDSKIVSELAHEHLLYQDKKGNAVFLHKDENGNNIGAEIQGTNSVKRYKGVAAGTTDSLFTIKIGKPTRAYIFESAIDLLSFKQIAKPQNLQNCVLVSMAGLKPNSLKNLADSGMELFACVDNDEAGKKFIRNNSFCSYDEHLSDYFSFEVYGFDIIIKNELLGEAVDNLPEKKRMIILMSYFLDMTDYEIADVLNLVRSTVTYHRESALAKLKRFMEEMTDDEGE